MKKILLASFVAASLLFAQEKKQAEVTAIDIEMQTQMNAPVKAEKKETLDKWQTKIRRQFRKNKNAKLFYGEATVQGTDLDPEFSTHLQTAFNEAFLQARAAQILQRSSEIARDEFRDIFTSNLKDSGKEAILKQKAANNLNIQKEEASRELNAARAEKAAELKNQKLKFDSIGEFMDSVLKEVSDAEIDAALAKDGVTNISNLSREEKITTYKNNYADRITQRASGEVIGLMPIQTYLYKEEGKNAYKLGLMAVFSNKTLQVVRDLKNKVPTRVKKEGVCKSIEDQVPIDDIDAMFHLIGPRLYYDENCEPVIVSYAQQDFVPQGDDEMEAELAQIARDEAKLIADAYIASVISSDISVKKNRSLNKTKEQEAILKAKVTVNLDDGADVAADEVQGNMQNKTFADTSKAFSENIEAHSKENLSGIETFDQWSTLDEDEGKYPRVVGVVNTYSSSQIIQTKEFYEQADRGYSTKAEQATQQKSKGGAVKVKSHNVNTIDDF